MLQEIASVQQVPGERRRRWFFCHELDVVFWFDADDAPVGFQLAYDKARGEHSFSWHAEKGYMHNAVDLGNEDGLGFATPLLRETSRQFPAARVARRFAELAANMPQELRDLVLEKINAST